ncbi:helix-turn-helix transcriptional regulator [Myroides sp. LJL116]
MVKKDFIKRQLAIVECLRKSPKNFEDIVRYLEDNENYYSIDFNISKRTFQRDCKDIESVWGVEIKYNKSLRVYEIIDDLEKDYNQRIIEIFDVVSAFKKREVLGDYLHLENKKAKGTEFLLSIGYAIQNNYGVKFTLNSYWQAPSTRKCIPIGIKESQNRYYLIGYDLDKKDFRNYGLDRISKFGVLEQVYETPDFDISKYYQNAFGIETYGEVSRIVLRFDQSQLKYLESLPIHSSQKIIKEEGYTFQVELQLYPTNDLVMELLRYGSNCEVLAPESFRLEMLDIVKELAQLYRV